LPVPHGRIGSIYVGGAQGSRPLLKLLVHAGIVPVLPSAGSGFRDTLARFQPRQVTRPQPRNRGGW
jgi:hypothetical protein